MDVWPASAVLVLDVLRVCHGVDPGRLMHTCGPAHWLHGRPPVPMEGEGNTRASMSNDGSLMTLSAVELTPLHLAFQVG